MSERKGDDSSDSNDPERRSADRLDTITDDFARLLGRRAPKAGEVIGGKYRLVERLGAGAMGEVWSAVNVAIDLKVAVKLLKRELIADKRFRVRFQREAVAIASVAHPNVARFFDVVVGDPTFMVMEFVEGRSLKSVIETEGRLQPERVVKLGIGIARALEAVHTAGVVHRDLKPSNIMLAKAGESETPRVIDFGLAKVTRADDGLTQPGQMVGTPDYMAPEQIAGHAVDARTDVYALGCVLFRMLTGLPPFAGEPVEVLYKHVHSAVPQVRNVPGVPPALAALVSRSLAKLPADRPKSATVMVQELERILVEMRAASSPLGQLKQLGANRALLVVAGLLALSGFLGGLGLGRQLSGDRRASGAGLLIVDSSPRNARVTVDGRELAEATPTALHGVGVGDHDVRLSASGYEEAVRRVTVDESGRASVSVTLTPTQRRIEIRTQPPGATVYVDDDPVANTTPVQISVKEGDFHAVRIEKNGYETATRPLRPEDKESVLELDLQPEKLQRGALLVDANLTGEVWIDGAYTGFVTPTLPIRLQPGKHVIELRAPDGARLDTSVVRLARGETRRVFMSASGK